MKIDNMQTDEFYQLELNQPNFEWPNDTWGGLFSGGRYGFEKKPSHWVTEYAQLRPVELITEVGPVPPRFNPVGVSDRGATIILLGVVLVVLSLWKRSEKL